MDWKLVAAAVVGIALLLMGSLGGGNKSAIPNGNNPAVESNDAIMDTEAAKSLSSSSKINQAEVILEQRVANILSSIQGVGDVKVVVYLVSGPEYLYATNNKVTERTVQEEDQGGGTRLTTEQTKDGQLVLVRTPGTGNEQAVVVKELTPEVQGVLVVATGADNVFVKEKLIRAVETMLNVQPHQVTVLTGEGR